MWRENGNYDEAFEKLAWLGIEPCANLNEKKRQHETLRFIYPVGTVNIRVAQLNRGGPITFKP